VIAILLFGSSKLPDLARSLGRSKSEFEKGLREGAKDKWKEKPTGEDEPDDGALSPR
jgi:TatA/E family protein of Tat protein translocase